MDLFMSSMLGAVISAPLYPAHSWLRLAFRGSACCVEITTVWIFFGSTEPSAFCRYSMVTCVLPSGRSHQSRPLLRTSVSTLPRRGHGVSQGHAVLGLIAGIAEHDALVAGTHIHVVLANVHATRDVRALLVDAHKDLAGLVAEALGVHARQVILVGIVPM